MPTALYSSNREKISVGSGEWLQLPNNREIQEVKTFSRRFLLFFFNLFSLSVKVNVCYFISYFRWIYDKTELCNIFLSLRSIFILWRSKISLLIISLRARPLVKIVDWVTIFELFEKKAHMSVVWAYVSLWRCIFVTLYLCIFVTLYLCMFGYLLQEPIRLKVLWVDA